MGVGDVSAVSCRAWGAVAPGAALVPPLTMSRHTVFTAATAAPRASVSASVLTKPLAYMY